MTTTVEQEPLVKLGPMHSDIWPWTKIDGRRHVLSWFMFRLCQLFPGRTFTLPTRGGSQSWRYDR